MKIFQRAAQREFAQTAAAVFVSLFAILLTTQMIRLLRQAAKGVTAAEGVATLMGFASISYLPVLLSLTLFISILLSLSRVYRDSEMVIWFSSGVPLTAWIKPVLRFAAPILLAIAALTLFLTPWSMTKRDEYLKRMDNRSDVARMSPGAFQESARGDRVFFVESVGSERGEDDRVKNVFISSVQHGRQGVIVASQGHTEMADNGDKFIVLSNGRRYEGEAGSTEFRTMEFQRYAIRMETMENLGIDQSTRNLSTAELLSDWSNHNKAELLWRFGVPLSALILSLLAIPLSFVNPRAGRTNNLLLALLTFMIYSNLLSVGKTWVAQGRLPFEIGVWAVHLLMCIALIALFWRRLAVTSVWRLWR
jgi:lipopolysaccharide export system permease protein